jgi:hypothetical protein
MGTAGAPTQLAVPIVLFVDLQLFHDLLANALHTANPQGCFPSPEFVPVIKIWSKRFPASSIC